MAIDPITIMMFALIALLIFFMFRNGKKRQAAMQELQNGLRPGAEVMLQSGIYGTIESIDEENNRVIIRSGTSTIEAHRNAVSQIVTASDAPVEDAPAAGGLAPDDDPEFGERVANGSTAKEGEAPAAGSESSDADASDTDVKPEGDAGDSPKA